MSTEELQALLGVIAFILGLLWLAFAMGGKEN